MCRAAREHVDEEARHLHLVVDVVEAERRKRLRRVPLRAAVAGREERYGGLDATALGDLHLVRRICLREDLTPSSTHASDEARYECVWESRKGLKGEAVSRARHHMRARTHIAPIASALTASIELDSSLFEICSTREGTQPHEAAASWFSRFTRQTCAHEPMPSDEGSVRRQQRGGALIKGQAGGLV